MNLACSLPNPKLVVNAAPVARIEIIMPHKNWKRNGGGERQRDLVLIHLRKRAVERPLIAKMTSRGCKPESLAELANIYVYTKYQDDNGYFLRQGLV